MKKNILLSIVAMAAIAFAQNNCPHPAFCKAVDNGEIDKAAKMYKNLGLTGIYCPSNLSLKDFEKIYYNEENAFIYCNAKFQREYGNSICSNKKNGQKCISFLKLYDINLWTKEMNDFYTSYGDDVCKSSVKDFEACLSLYDVNKNLWKNEWTENWLKWLGKNVCASKDDSIRCNSLLNKYYPKNNNGEISKIYNILVKNYLKNKVFVKSKKLKNKKVVKYISTIEKDRLIDIAYYIIVQAQSFFAWDMDMIEILALYNSVFGKECILVADAWGDKEPLCNPLQKGFHFAELIDFRNVCSKGRYERQVLNLGWDDYEQLYEFDRSLCRDNNCSIGCLYHNDIQDPMVLNNEGLLSKVLSEYKQSANINDRAILRLCRLSFEIDKKVEKQMGFEVFSCKKTFEKYNKVCTKEMLNRIIVTNLNEEHHNHRSDFVVCDTAGWRMANEYESFVGVCNEADFGKVVYDFPNDTIICDKKERRWISAARREKILGSCTKNDQGKKTYGMVCNNLNWEQNNKGDDLVDSRDGHVYKTVKIGNRVWMAENLNYDPGKKGYKTYCYEDSLKNCDKYGRLYSYEVALNRYSRDIPSDDSVLDQGICPDGWHIPNKNEWRELINYIGTDAKKWKSISDKWIGFDNYNECETQGFGFDVYGFSVKPAGCRSAENFSPYQGKYKEACFWSSTIMQENYPYFLCVGDKNVSVGDGGADPYIGYSFSIRCLKN